jgi:hypothetical protein
MHRYPDPVEEDLDQVQFFVQMWAEAVIRQIERVRERRKKYADDLWLYDHEPLGIAPTKEDLEDNFRVMWAEEHTLIWAAHQLERWNKRLAFENGRKPPEPDAVLANVRNALEHLDEADFEDYHAVPGDLGDNRSLRALGGLPLTIGTSIGGNLISPQELEKRALAVVERIADEEYAKEMGYIEQSLIDELRGK